MLNLSRPFWITLSSFVFANFCHAQVLNIDPQSVDAQAWIIIDPQSKQVIAEHAADQQRAPASLTKMMVGYLTLQALEAKKISLDQIVSVPDVVNTVMSDESRLKLKPNDQISIEELLSSLVIMSANDAALTLATVISGDVPSFLRLMNETAKKLGMHNTNFSNPSGITMTDHYSSARDLSLLTQAIVIDTPRYMNYSKQQVFSYKELTHQATNLLLKKYPNMVDGFKTGYTQAAGYNLALSANKIDPKTQKPRRLLVIVMGSSSKQKRADVAETLMNIAYNYTQNKQLIESTHKIATFPIRHGQYQQYSVYLKPNQGYHTLSLLAQPTVLNAAKFDQKQQRFILDDKNKTWLEPLISPKHIRYQTTLLKNDLVAPLKQNNVALAKVTISQFNQPIHHVQINADLKLEQESIWQKMTEFWQQSLNKVSGISKPVIYGIPSE